jgi:ribosomal protein S10
MEQFLIQIASVPYRDKLIAEIQYNNYIIAELNQERDEVRIEVFSYDDLSVDFSVDDFIETIKAAKRKLVGE